MDELIVRRLQGRASDLEIRKLERWRQASAENERTYREVERLWEVEPMEAPAPRPRPTSADIVTEAEERRRRIARRASGMAALRSRWLAYGLAAAAVLALLYSMGQGDGSVHPAGSALAAVQSSAGPGDVTTMSLSDGSVVRMASGSRLDFPPSSDRREVVLEGRAFFAVASGDRPFVVRTSLGDVSVVGTRFEVAAEDELRLVVVEGVVRLGRAGNRGGDQVEVHAGQVAYLDARGGARVATRDDVWDLLDWDGGLLLFQATPLSEVAREMSRHFGRDVRVVDEEAAPLRVTAWFEGESLEEVVDAVCLVAGVTCTVGESEVTIGR